MQANFFDLNKNKENDSASSTTTTGQPETNNVEPETVYGNEVSKTNSNRSVATDENSVQNSSGDQNPKFGTSEETNSKSEKKSRRRGVWKRVRVRPVDSFETAESQNIGKQLYNTIISDNVKEFGERNNKRTSGTRIISSPSAYAYEETVGFNDDSDTHDHLDDNNDEVQTILPIHTTESTKTDDFDATTIENEWAGSSEATTDPIEKDERELEATSTYNYDVDDFSTTIMPFISSDVSDLESLEKSTERPKTSSPSGDDKMAKSGDDQITEPSSIMDEVKQKLTELFSFEDDDVVVSTTERVFKFNRNFKRPKSPQPIYTSIDRNPSANDIGNSDKDSAKDVKTSPATMKLEPVPVLKTILRPITEPSSFHKELMVMNTLNAPPQIRIYSNCMFSYFPLLGFGDLCDVHINGN